MFGNDEFILDLLSIEDSTFLNTATQQVMIFLELSQNNYSKRGIVIRIIGSGGVSHQRQRGKFGANPTLYRSCKEFPDCGLNSQNAHRCCYHSDVRVTLSRSKMKTSATNTLNSIQQQTVRFTLSLPVQATLYTSLCALTLWTIYFSTYPAVHNQAHSLRHNTLMVGCH